MIEQVYMSESFYYVCEKEMGRNKLVHVSLHDYIEAVLERIDIEKIQKQKFHLLINKRNDMLQHLLMLFCKGSDAQLHGFMQVNKRIM